MTIRILNESDAQLYQELRLSALKINPEDLAQLMRERLNSLLKL
ncbi:MULTISPECIES: hypothetical protein [unclassified Paenibacillus]|nr:MULTISPECIES: hypothetical protein [unclassified Paenibacillus]GIP30887.1 hypothetical protein J2TS4_00970 [Paenibacillus sp. J2TS4]